jgi:Flp pilus assembly protein TadG
MTNGWLRRLSSASGAAMVEVAVALPILIVIVIGTVDLARVFYMAMELQNAARAGAQYGAQGVGNSADTTVMRSTAVAAAVNINSVSAFASQNCFCASDTNPQVSAVACSGTCTSGQHVVISVTVTAASTFSLISFYPMPGIPRSFSIFRAATLRAQ